MRVGEFVSGLKLAMHSMWKWWITTVGKSDVAKVVNMVPIHPGRILKRELLARELSANRLALSLRVPSGRISDILNGKRGISPETALRLARYFGTSATFWVNLQARYDLALADRDLGAKIAAEVPKAAA